MRRRSRSLGAERLAVALAAAGIVLGSFTATTDRAQADDVAVVVHLGETTATIGGGELRAAYDIFERGYTIRAPDGTESTPPAQITGASIRTVLQLAGVNPDTVAFLQIQRGDRSWSVLRGSDLSANPPFPDGPPIVFSDFPAVRYLRPVRGPTDANSADNLATQTNQPLEIFAHTGNLLDVSAQADSASVKVGDPVTFSATASGELPGENVSFTWDFGDSDTANGATAVHSFNEEGSYRVLATAAGDEDSGGTSDFVTVQVGPAPPSGDDETPGGGPSVDPDTLTEGPRDGGHQGGTAGGTGNGNGGAGRNGGGGPGSESGSPGGSSTGGAPSSGPSPSSTAPVATAPATPPASGAADTDDRSHGPRPPVADDVVIGQLLSGVGSPVASSAAAPPAVTHAPTAAVDPLTVPTGIAVAITLLVAGGLRELRRFQRPDSVAP